MAGIDAVLVGARRARNVAVLSRAGYVPGTVEPERENPLRRAEVVRV